jgi:predicted LPLAT superfamily acyltransferase
MGGILWLVSLYYTCVYSRVRKASREYLERVLAESPGFWNVHHHVAMFARVAFHRVLWVSAKHHSFDVHTEENGGKQLAELSESGNGALFLTSHMGNAAAFSPELMPVGFKMNIAGYYSNAEKINTIYSNLSSAGAPTVINLEDIGASSMVYLHDLLEKGQGVTLAADRIGVGDRTLDLEFLGSPVSFPAGPFLLAALSHCPVFFAVAVFSEPNRYDLICRRLHSGVNVSRGERDEAALELARSYVDQLESCCKAYPFNWFNFYPFWDRSD